MAHNPRGGLLAGNETKLYVRSMGKAFEVTGLFASDDEANDWMSRHSGHGVIACAGNLVIVASMYDGGTNAAFDLPTLPAKMDSPHAKYWRSGEVAP